jgi:uncharacterized protein (TIGR02757 family)
MKEKLDALVEKYETADFIKNDPVQFPHRYKNMGLGREDVEIAGFISALFAYGKREAFIQKLDTIFSTMNGSPYDFLLNYPNRTPPKNFAYRFVKDIDLHCLLDALSKLYRDKSSLAELFSRGTQHVADYFREFAQNTYPNCSMGFYHLISDPKKGGAQKRVNMFLRWMVRSGPVDLGVWDFICKSKLIIPLDVHVGRVSRSLCLLQRRTNDFKAAVELSEKLKTFDPKDPVKYDFALFGEGISGGGR